MHRDEIRKILCITLSNVGDVILTLPVLDALKMLYPQASITVVVGPRPKEILENNPAVERLVIYDKHSRLRDKIRLFKELRRENFDIVVDLRNSLFGALLPAKAKTPPWRYIPKGIRHMKQRHLYRLKDIKVQTLFTKSIRRSSFYNSPQDEQYINRILEAHAIKANDVIVVIAPGAKSHTKRWDKDKFADLAARLVSECKARIILVGDNNDAAISSYIAARLGSLVIDLAGKTNFAQLAFLLKKASLLVANDSAIPHLASYFNIPTVAIFGPTNERTYGPWSESCAVVKKDIFCRPCEKAQCKFATLECMQLVTVEDVLRQVRNILIKDNRGNAPGGKNIFKRILVVRTDRIGDVLLSTPVLKALRDAYPSAYIAMMVSPYAKDIVVGNPYLDQVIIYDKDGKHHSWMRSFRFAMNLKKKRFDAAIILHPTNRVHLITFFAGIPRRIGYDRKLGFLLTDRLRHTKQEGAKHELEYALDVVRYLGIEPPGKQIFMPLKPESEKLVEELLEQEGVSLKDKLLAIHPGASCPSKVWPGERFAEAADRLAEKYGFKIVLVAGPKDIKQAQVLAGKIRNPVINLSGRTSISQLASVLKRCQLFISNDSGPVHIASAVGTPVISLFGRSQKGLSHRRWGPVGKRDQALHKTIGCIECIAHNCVKDFACLKSITVEDVLKAAERIMSCSAP